MCELLRSKFKPINTKPAFLSYLPLMVSKPSIDSLDKSCNALPASITATAPIVGKSFIFNLTFTETPFPSNGLTEVKNAWTRTTGSSQKTEHANRDLPHHPKVFFSILEAINSTQYETVTETLYCQLIHNYWFFFPAECIANWTRAIMERDSNCKSGTARWWG